MSKPDSSDYYEAIRATGSDDWWKFEVYHYDETGDKKIVVHCSDLDFPSKAAAEDAAWDWCEDNGIDAEMS
jgi:hypothetical protein